MDSWPINATTVAGLGDTDASSLYYPKDVFVDDSGDIYILDSGNRRVQLWLANAISGTTLISGSAGTGLNQFAASKFIVK